MEGKEYKKLCLQREQLFHELLLQKIDYLAEKAQDCIDCIKSMNVPYPPLWNKNRYIESIFDTIEEHFSFILEQTTYDDFVELADLNEKINKKLEEMYIEEEEEYFTQDNKYMEYDEIVHKPIIIR